MTGKRVVPLVGGSGDTQIVMLLGRASFLVSQLREPYWSDKVPVASDRAALEPRPTEAKCLQRTTGDPDRREEMASAATHDDMPAQSVPTPSEDKCLSGK
jgi:hypothetical protein